MNSESSVDYLSKLPVEIWKAILLAIVPHRILDAGETTDPFIFLHKDEVGYQRIMKLMKCRLSLLTVCKALHPLAEELLYSKIGLGKAPMGDRFRKAAMGQTVDGKKCRGELTTHMWVYYGNTASTPLDLRTFCPNLREFHHEFDFSLALDLDAMIHDHPYPEITTLTLEYCDFQWKDMRTLSVCFPKLTTLNLLDVDSKPGDTSEPIIFPHLHSLTIESSVGRIFPFSQLRFPSLRWMCVRQSLGDKIEHLSSVFNSTKNTLIGLQISGKFPFACYPQILDIVFSNLPHLETAIFPIIVHESHALVGTPRTTCPRNLLHLVLTVPWGIGAAPLPGFGSLALQPYAEYCSSRTVFPRLKRVTLAFLPRRWAARDETVLRFVDGGKEAFPHLVVEGGPNQL